LNPAQLQPARPPRSIECVVLNPVSDTGKRHFQTFGVMSLHFMCDEMEVGQFDILVVCQGDFGWSSALALQSGRRRARGFSH